MPGMAAVVVGLSNEQWIGCLWELLVVLLLSSSSSFASSVFFGRWKEESRVKIGQTR
jgi:hypothetical protein